MFGKIGRLASEVLLQLIVSKCMSMLLFGLEACTLNKSQLKGSVKEPNISIYFFSAHHSMVFYFQCSVYWWKGSVRF